MAVRLYLPHHPLLRSHPSKNSRLFCQVLGTHSYTLANWSFPDALLLCTKCALYILAQYPHTHSPSDIVTYENPEQAIQH